MRAMHPHKHSYLTSYLANQVSRKFCKLGLVQSRIPNTLLYINTIMECASALKGVYHTLKNLSHYSSPNCP